MAYRLAAVFPLKWAHPSLALVSSWFQAPTQAFHRLSNDWEFDRM
jgi:hypothetical protein